MKKYVLILIVLVLSSVQIAFIVLHSNGVAGYTNSPGETTCTDCHVTYPLNTAGGKVAITIPNCVTGNYIPGATYTINVTVAKNGLWLFGIDLEVLDSLGSDAGTLSVINNSTTTLLNATINGHNRTNGAQYGGVYATDSCVFAFKWVAPNNNVGNINLYASGNAANGDGYTDGDYIFTTTSVITPSSALQEKQLRNTTDFFVFVNPSDNTLTISYYVAGEHTYVSVDLIDLNGQAVMHLVNEFNEPGQHQKRVLLPSSINKGMYLARIIIGERTYFKKVLLQ